MFCDHIFIIIYFTFAMQLLLILLIAVEELGLFFIIIDVNKTNEIKCNTYTHDELFIVSKTKSTRAQNVTAYTRIV